MDSKKLGEEDVIDWVVINGVVSERCLSKKSGWDKKELSELIKKQEKEGVLISEKSFLRKNVLFNPNSEKGKKRLMSLMPSVVVEGKEKKFKTALDQMKYLVDRFEKIEMSTLAHFLESDKTLIESWAKILHQQNMITLYYPLAGDAVLMRNDESGNPINSTLIKYVTFTIIVLGLIIWRQQVNSAINEIVYVIERGDIINSIGRMF